MAKDIFVNIMDLAQVTEVANGDYIIVETPNGTRIIDFQNFIIPNANLLLSNAVEENTTAILSATTTLNNLGIDLNLQLTTLDTKIATSSATILEQSNQFNSTITSKVEEISAAVDLFNLSLTDVTNAAISGAHDLIYVGTADVDIQKDSTKTSFGLTPEFPTGLDMFHISITPTNAYAAKNMAFVTAINDANKLITITGAFSGTNPATEVASYAVMAVYKLPIS
jgi:hypothetical protein